MGNNLSLTEGQLEEISQKTNYSPEVIKGMYIKFTKLDKTEKGYVSTSDLSQICDFDESVVNKKVVEELSAGFGDQVDFRALIEYMSSFQHAKEEKKLECNALLNNIFSSFSFD